MILEKFLNSFPLDSIYGIVGSVADKRFSWKRLRYYRENRLVGMVYTEFSKDSREKGKRVSGRTKVETLDCCCLIVNSKIIRERNLSFDENLAFHLYVEDFSLTAREKGIDTYVDSR